MGENILSLWNIFIDAAKKQGISFLILIGIIFYFHTQLDKLQLQIESCNSENKEAMKTYLNEMKEIIIRNTAAFENLKNENHE